MVIEEGQLASDAEHLRMAISVGNIGIWELDVEGGHAWRNEMHDRIFGYSELQDDWTYEQFLGHVVEEDRERVDALFQSAVETRGDWSFECRIVRVDGLTRWISANGRALTSEAGETTRLIGHVLDVTETKRNEEHLRLVTAELNHRLKNIIGTISGLIGMAGRETGDRKASAQVLQQRIAALGRSHNLTFRSKNETVPLADVVRTEQAALPEGGERMIIDIDERLHIQPNAAEGLTLVLHELTTNAVKYGALSNESGTVVVESSLLEDGSVELCWRERGGPTVTPPESKGFGSTLVRSALNASAKVEQSYTPEGMVCRIVFPASEISTAR